MPRFFEVLLVAALLSGPALAQDQASPVDAPASRLALELNGTEPSAAGCRVTLLATNDLGTDIDGATLELALFGPAGGMERLVSLDLKAMIEGKTMVLQFDLADLDCEAIGRVLVNDVTTCTGAGLSPAACLAALDTTSRTDVVFDL